MVPDHQLSLAIGREGQNARLAARLTGWRIDIRSESQFREALEAELMSRFSAAAEQAASEYTGPDGEPVVPETDDTPVTPDEEK